MTDEEVKHFMNDQIGVDNIERAYENIRKIKESCKDYSLKKPLKIPRLNWKSVNVTKACITCKLENTYKHKHLFPLDLCECCDKYIKVN